MDYYDYITRIVVELPGVAALGLLVLGAIVVWGGGLSVRRLMLRLDTQDAALALIRSMLARELRAMGERLARVEGVIGLPPPVQPPPDDDDA